MFRALPIMNLNDQNRPWLSSRYPPRYVILSEAKNLPHWHTGCSLCRFFASLRMTNQKQRMTSKKIPPNFLIDVREVFEYR